MAESDAAKSLTFSEAARLIEAMRERALADISELRELRQRLTDIEANYAMINGEFGLDAAEVTLWFCFGIADDERVGFSLKEIQALKRVAEMQLMSEEKRRG